MCIVYDLDLQVLLLQPQVEHLRFYMVKKWNNNKLQTKQKGITPLFDEFIHLIFYQLKWRESTNPSKSQFTAYGLAFICG